MTSEEITYSIAKVAELIGVTKNRIRHWCKLGYIPDTDWISLGNRQHRRFSDRHVEFIRTINRLRSEGFELAAAAEKAKLEIQRVKELL